MVPVTATSAPEMDPTVDGMMSLRSAASSVRGRVGSVALDRDGDVRDGLCGVDVDVDRLIHEAGGQRTARELADRLLDGRRLDIRSLDHDTRSDVDAGKGRLDAVVAAEELLRIAVDAGLGRVELVRGDREATRNPPANAAEIAGCLSTRSIIAPQIRPSPSLRRNRWTNGTDSVDAVAELGEQGR